MKLAGGAALGVAGPASAGHIEFVKKVAYTNDFGELKLHDVGDPRYMAVTRMSLSSKDGGLDVLDLDTGTILRVATSRRALAKVLGTTDLAGELVSYTPSAAGL